MMGGSVDYERDDERTRFTVRLPMVAAESAMIIHLPTAGVGA